MNTSVYISDERIQVLVGNVSSKKSIDIKSCMYVSLPDGAVINGQINNEQFVKDALQKLWNKYNISKKEIYLVVDSSTILNKRMEVPALPEPSIQMLIQEEFKDVEGVQNLLFDYTVMRNGKNGKPCILCNAVNKDFIASYIKVFKSLDIELKAIDTSTSAEFKVFERIKPMSTKDCILIILDGNKMTSILHKSGCYCYSTKSILTEERGSKASPMEISTNTSPLIQFARSDGDRKNITGVFVCGALQGEENLCNELSNIMGIQVDIIPTSIDFTYQGDMQKAQYILSDYIYNVGTLIRQ